MNKDTAIQLSEDARYLRQRGIGYSVIADRMDCAAITLGKCRAAIIAECAKAADETAARFEILSAETPTEKELLDAIAQGARHAAAEIRSLKS